MFYLDDQVVVLGKTLFGTVCCISTYKGRRVYSVELNCGEIRDFLEEEIDLL